MDGSPLPEVLSGIIKNMKKVLNIFLYGIAGVIGFSLLIACFYGLRYVWYMRIVSLDLGEPAYSNTWLVHERTDPISFSQKVALVKFPDVASCIEANTDDPSVEELMKMSWHKMQTDAQVEICTFRILATLGNISFATPWLEEQGFSNSANLWTSENPYFDIYDQPQVSGNWNTRENGLRWPESGLKRQILSLPILWPPYGTSISTTWSVDGTQLLNVQVSQTRL